MPPRKKKETSAPDLLWKAADKLRGVIDAAQYKTTVLTLLYLRYLGAEFDQARRKIGEAEVLDGDNPQHYVDQGLRWLPPTARWGTIEHRVADWDQETLSVLNEAFVSLMRSNRDLTDVFPSAATLFGGMDRRGIIDLFALFSSDPVIVHGQRSERDVSSGQLDYLNTSYTYSVAKFAAAEGKRGGEFFTPPSVARLLVQVLQPQGSVYDPCCGLGGLLVEAAKFMEAHGGDPSSDLALFGQELNHQNWRLARMHLDIHGLRPAAIHRADTLGQDLLPTEKFDFALANPPFNISDWARNEVDPRWEYGVPPKSNANFAWLQHIVDKLDTRGSAGIVLANGSMSSTMKSERDIRRAMAEDDVIACIVALPAQLFRTTQIPACAWFLTKDKSPQGERGLADRRGETLFLDARTMGSMVDRAHRVLTVSDLDAIAGTYHSWRGTGALGDTYTYRDVPGFCRSVGIEEIREHQHVLTPGRYVGVEDLREAGRNGPGPQHIDLLTRELFELIHRADQVEAEMRQHLDAGTQE